MQRPFRSSTSTNRGDLLHVGDGRFFDRHGFACGALFAHLNFGFHSSARCCAWKSWAGVIRLASASRSSAPNLSPCAAPRMYHLWAMTKSCGTPLPRSYMSQCLLAPLHFRELRTDETSPRPSGYLGPPLSLQIQSSQIRCSLHIPLDGSFLPPLPRLDVVLGDTLAVGILLAEMELGGCESPLSQRRHSRKAVA